MRAGCPLILGYHGVGNIDARLDPIRLFVRPLDLRRQVRGLLDRGYELVTMGEFALRAQAAASPPRGLAALTFDDGTADHAHTLPGLLEELSVPATVYVCPGLAGLRYPWTSPESDVRFMTEPELVSLSSHPLVELGAHTNEHHELHEADFDSALEEMVACKQTLESLLATEVPSFCYPRCHYSEDARLAARSAGYTSAVTCGMRGSWDPFELKREVFHLDDGPAVSALRTRGWYAGLGEGLPARLARLAARRCDRLSAVGRRRPS